MNPYRTSYQSILFPIDELEAAERAAPFVARVAQRLDAPVEVQMNRRSASLDLDVARGAVEKIAESLTRRGARASAQVASSARETDGVRQVVESDGHDLILLVSDGQPSLLERLLGGRTRELLVDSPCDVLCVDGDQVDDSSAIRRIVVPVNYQEESVASLGRALTWADDETRIQLHYDVPSTFPFLHTARGVSGDHSVDTERVDEVWQDELSSFWAQHGDADVQVDLSRGAGNWSDGTIDAATTSGAHLIVATSSGRGRVGFAEQLAIGSTPCPVLLVQPAAPDSEQPVEASDAAWVGEVLDFWFGELDSSGAASEIAARWWQADARFDREVRERFGVLHASASHGHLVVGEDAREGLAALIVLDQFSRNLGRGTSAMYANDEQALTLARRITRSGQDKQLPAAMRAFCYLPFMHSEDLEDQRYCVALFEVAAYESTGPAREAMNEHLEFAKRHLDVIERFGRFPHRNELLNREATESEREFLEVEGRGF